MMEKCQVFHTYPKNMWKYFEGMLLRQQAIMISRNDKPTFISTQMYSLIPPSKISSLTQGMFVGAVSDNFDERIEQKIFHCEIVVENAAVAAETKAYKKIPEIVNFTDADGKDTMQTEIDLNYKQIKQDVLDIVKEELERIEGDESLRYLLKKGE